MDSRCTLFESSTERWRRDIGSAAQRLGQTHEEWFGSIVRMVRVVRVVSERSNDERAERFERLRRFTSGVVKASKGALEPLVQRTGDLRRHRAEARPLRLRAADLLLGIAPAQFLVLFGRAAAGNRVRGKTLAPFLR